MKPLAWKPAWLGALVSLTATAALAAPITVNNPSFETPPSGGFPFGCGTGCSFSQAVIPGWTNGGFSGQFIPGTQVGNVSFFNTISDGITVAYSNAGTISQTVGATVQAGVAYTLQVDLGWRKDIGAFIGTADLLVNGNQYAATGATPVQGNWSTFTATYTGLPADVGDPITIQLNSPGTQADFDNVRLSDNLASVPAPALGSGPATCAVFCGALALFYLKRLLFTRRERVRPVVAAL
jgi:hypothetical protein